ncbi:hypothetical protein M011DRAFT_307528 [Sporormia fimetaria CBS 119925]|uniref:Uncharacterized protein n=1 Tax=Sporormia fimetaria CBS 119925 TaxID=1340428 RepID=A0A6A6VFT9_9PLEO|nr:hypothetical protein M011DRAFT_307528 [Sporormia fimetaria CBS 119925]
MSSLPVRFPALSLACSTASLRIAMWVNGFSATLTPAWPRGDDPEHHPTNPIMPSVSPYYGLEERDKQRRLRYWAPTASYLRDFQLKYLQRLNSESSLGPVQRTRLRPSTPCLPLIPPFKPGIAVKLTRSRSMPPSGPCGAVASPAVLQNHLCQGSLDKARRDRPFICSVHKVF